MGYIYSQSEKFQEQISQHDVFGRTGRMVKQLKSFQIPASPDKKKHFRLLDRVKDFLRLQPPEVKQEFNAIAWKLEHYGYLNYPYGEKVEGEDLFAIRVVQAGNVRVFYVYGLNDYVYGIHGYVKKTDKIPEKELKEARRAFHELIIGGFIK